MNSNIILSICIPTFNRSGNLESTLTSIVNQNRFQQTNDVEIIISDNCSSDNTAVIASGFVKKYGEKIRYFRNDTNIVDGNFEKSLSHGKGLFLKLNNDTLEHYDGSLDKILETIYENTESRNILFFSNGALPGVGKTICKNLDSFIEIVSFYSTWIGAFGIWKEDFDRLENFSRRSSLNLTQVDVLYRLINSKRSVFINNEKLCNSVQPAKRGGYDILGVFMENYIFLLTEQLENKAISEIVFETEKKRVLYYFIRPWFIQHKLNPETYIFDNKNSLRRIYSYYSFSTFSCFIIYYSLSLCYNFVKKIFGLDKPSPNTSVRI